MANRRPGAAGGLRWPLASLLAVACAAGGCGQRSAERPPVDTVGPDATSLAEAARPQEADPDSGAEVPPAAEAAAPDAAGESGEAARDAAPSPPDWPETPLVVQQELPTLERACTRRDWDACTALADRLADGPAEKRDEPRADALYARACEQGRRGNACRRLGLRLLRSSAAPMADDAAALRLEQACAGGLLDACEVLGALQVRGERVRRDVYGGLQRLQHACNAGYAAACGTIRTLREAAESYDLPLPRAVAPKPVEAGQEPEAEAACPALFHGAAAVAPGERLERNLARLAPEALAAALPETVDGWTIERPAVPGGDALRRGTVVGARVVADGRSVELVVRDRASECTLQPGTGEAMLARTGRGAEGRRTAQVRGEPAVLAGPSEARALTCWIAERCEVRLAGSGVPDDRLLELARALDLATLRRECARRETTDGTVVYE